MHPVLYSTSTITLSLLPDDKGIRAPPLEREHARLPHPLKVSLKRARRDKLVIHPPVLSGNERGHLKRILEETRRAVRVLHEHLVQPEDEVGDEDLADARELLPSLGGVERAVARGELEPGAREERPGLGRDVVNKGLNVS